MVSKGEREVKRDRVSKSGKKGGLKKELSYELLGRNYHKVIQIIDSDYSDLLSKNNENSLKESLNETMDLIYTYRPNNLQGIKKRKLVKNDDMTALWGQLKVFQHDYLKNAEELSGSYTKTNIKKLNFVKSDAYKEEVLALVKKEKKASKRVVQEDSSEQDEAEENDDQVDDIEFSGDAKLLNGKNTLRGNTNKNNEDDEDYDLGERPSEDINEFIAQMENQVTKLDGNDLDLDANEYDEMYGDEGAYEDEEDVDDEGIDQMTKYDDDEMDESLEEEEDNDNEEGYFERITGEHKTEFDEDDEELEKELEKFEQMNDDYSESEEGEEEDEYDEQENDEEMKEEGIENEDSKEKVNESENEQEQEDILESEEFKKHQKEMLRQMSMLEDENLKEKIWQESGEVSAAQRPVESLLDADLSHDHLQKSKPLITEERTLELEQIIINRIVSGIFDDPTPPKEENIAKDIIDDGMNMKEKSKKSLAQVYEEEYLKRVDGYVPINEEEEKINKMQEKVQFTVAKVLHKLNSLSSFHYVSSAPVVSMKPVQQKSSLSSNKEEKTLMSVSEETEQAPEQIMQKATYLPVGESERNSKDNKTKRRKKKSKEQKKSKVAKDIAEKLNPGKSYDEEQLKKIKELSDKIVKESDPKDAKQFRSSKAFFQAVQEQTDNALNKGKRAKKNRPADLDDLDDEQTKERKTKIYSKMM